MRIVHIITRLVNGGADENTVTTCNWSAAHGDEVFLVHGSELRVEIRSKLHPQVSLVSVPSLVRQVHPIKDARALFHLWKVLRELRPDIVHTHTSKAGILGRLAARAMRAETIVHGVHIVPFDNVGKVPRLAYLAAERLTARFTDAFISVSEGMRRLCLDAKVGGPDRHHVVHSGFDLARFKSATPPDDWRSILNVGPGQAKPFVVVMLAAFEARKRHLEFLEVIREVASFVPGVRFVLAGEGPLRSQVQARVDQLGLSSNVCLPGFRADPERLIAMADVCALASIREGLPRVVMQYLATGKPALVCQLPGLEEVIRDGLNGFVLPSEDLRPMARRLVAVANSEELLAHLARGAASTDLSSWDAACLGERTNAVYVGLRQRALDLDALSGLPRRV